MSRRERAWLLGVGLEIAMPLARARRSGVWTAGARATTTRRSADILTAFEDTWLFERFGSDVVPEPAAARRRLRDRGRAGSRSAGAGSASAPTLRRMVAPIVEFLRAIPAPALIPFAILVPRRRERREDLPDRGRLRLPGAAEHDRRRRRASSRRCSTRRRVYRIGALDRLRYVVLPAAAPQIFAGMRTSLSLSLILMVISEMVASSNGIGYFILQSQRSFAITEMWSGILLLGLLGYLFNFVFTLVERRVLAWHRGAGRARGEEHRPMLKVTTSARPTGRARRREAIGDLSFEVGAGEFVCIVGPSGCGKTTLLKTMSGLLAPTSGTVELDGERVDGPPEQMALVFQDYSRSLFPWMTVAENVEFPLRRKPSGSERRRSGRRRRSSRSGSTGFADKYPWQLSGGMQQRVAIARGARLPARDPADGRAVRLRRRADPRRPRGSRAGDPRTTTGSRSCSSPTTSTSPSTSPTAS